MILTIASIESNLTIPNFNSNIPNKDNEGNCYWSATEEESESSDLSLDNYSDDLPPKTVSYDNHDKDEPPQDKLHMDHHEGNFTSEEEVYLRKVNKDAPEEEEAVDKKNKVQGQELYDDNDENTAPDQNKVEKYDESKDDYFYYEEEGEQLKKKQEGYINNEHKFELNEFEGDSIYKNKEHKPTHEQEQETYFDIQMKDSSQGERRACNHIYNDHASPEDDENAYFDVKMKASPEGEKGSCIQISNEHALSEDDENKKESIKEGVQKQEYDETKSLGSLGKKKEEQHKPGSTFNSCQNITMYKYTIPELSIPLGLTFSQYKNKSSKFKIRNNYCIVSDVKPNSPASRIGFQIADLLCYDTINTTPTNENKDDEDEVAVAASYEEVSYWFSHRKRPFDISVKRGDFHARRIIQECVMGEIINQEILDGCKKRPYSDIESEIVIQHPFPFQCIVYVNSKNDAPYSGGYAYVIDYHPGETTYDVQYIFGRKETNIPYSCIHQVSLDALPPINNNLDDDATKLNKKYKDNEKINLPFPKGTVVKISQYVDSSIPKEGSYARIVSYDPTYQTYNLKLCVGGNSFKDVELDCITFLDRKDTMNMFNSASTTKTTTSPCITIANQNTNTKIKDKIYTKKTDNINRRQNYILKGTSTFFNKRFKLQFTARFFYDRNRYMRFATHEEAILALEILRNKLDSDIIHDKDSIDKIVKHTCDTVLSQSISNNVVNDTAKVTTKMTEKGSASITSSSPASTSSNITTTKNTNTFKNYILKHISIFFNKKLKLRKWTARFSYDKIRFMRFATREEAILAIAILRNKLDSDIIHDKDSIDEIVKLTCDTVLSQSITQNDVDDTTNVTLRNSGEEGSASTSSSSLPSNTTNPTSTTTSTTNTTQGMNSANNSNRWKSSRLPPNNNNNDNNSTKETIIPKNTKWLPCENPWGDNGHSNEDFILLSSASPHPNNILQSPSSKKVFSMKPLDNTSCYSSVAYKVFFVTRDRDNKLPWGFTFDYNSNTVNALASISNDSCVITSITPCSPAEAAKDISGKNDDECLQVGDNIIACNGQLVAGMTDYDLSVKLEMGNSRIVIAVSRVGRS